MSGLDLQQPRDRPHELIGAVPRRLQRRRTVLAAQAELKCLKSGRRAGAVPVGIPLALAPLQHLGLGTGQHGRGLLIGAVQTCFAFLVGGYRYFQRRKLLFGGGSAGPALLDRLLQPADLCLSSLDSATPRPHLAGELGQTFAAICSSPHQTGEPGGLGDVGGLDLAAGGDRSLQRLPGLCGLGNQHLLLLAYRLGLSAQQLRIAGAVVGLLALIL